MRKLKFLVVGTGRSGTVFMARLLTSLGVPCGHEAVFDYGGIDTAVKRLRGETPTESSWVSKSYLDHNTGWHALPNWLPDAASAIAESSYLAVPFLGHSCLEGTKFIHVVRDPVKVVHSYCHYIGFGVNSSPANGYEELVYAHVPEMRLTMPQYDRVALFWVRWNAMAEAAGPELLHRIESNTSVVKDFVGGSGEPFDERSVNTFRRSCSDRFFPNKIASREIRDEFVATGKRYGYAMRLEQMMA